MQVNYTAPPTVADFMASDAFMRILAGPVGSGKTTGCIFELLKRAAEQIPGPDGFRRTRYAIVRQTLQQLKQTVLKDIETWLSGIVRWKVSENTVFIEAGDIKSEWFLIPLEDPEDQRRLLSMQLTMAWISEAIEIDVDLVPAIAGRVGRYPSAAQGGATFAGIIADTNMPSIGSPWWVNMELKPPPDWQMFIQPGGLHTHAENLDFLLQTAETLRLPVGDPERLAQGRKYYLRLANQHSEDWVKRYVHAQYGDDPSGSAVFRASFKQAFHVARDPQTLQLVDVEPVVQHPILIGQDFGRNPCAVVCQMDHKGRLLILDEIISEDVGLELHLQRALRPILMGSRYLGRAAAIVGDPAGMQRSTTYEETSFDVCKRNGFMAFPAPTNNIDARLRAVEMFLLEQRDGGPALLIDGNRCPVLVRALNGAYRFGKTKAGQLKPLPEKTHPHSDIADALQYVCAVAQGGMMNLVTSRLGPRATFKGNKRERPSVRGWT